LPPVDDITFRHDPRVSGDATQSNRCVRSPPPDLRKVRLRA
jgi:hypothetical protein